MSRSFEVRCGQCGRFIAGVTGPLPPPSPDDIARRKEAGLPPPESGVQLFGIQRGPIASGKLRANLDAMGLKEKGCDNCLGVNGGVELMFKVAKQNVARLEKEVERLRKDGRTNAICCDEFEEALETGKIYRTCGRWAMKIESNGDAVPGDFEKKFVEVGLQAIEEKIGKTSGAEFMMAWCPFCKQKF